MSWMLSFLFFLVLLNLLFPSLSSYEKDYEKLQIISDSDDIGKLITIVEEFKTILMMDVSYLRLGKKAIPEHIMIADFPEKSNKVIGFLQIDGGAFTSRIKNFNELVINHKDIKFQLWRDVRKPDITGKVGKEEIERLNNAPNGQFSLMEKVDRIEFELLYKLITSIQNRDLDIEMEKALEFLLKQMKHNWLIRNF